MHKKCMFLDYATNHRGCTCKPPDLFGHDSLKLAHFADISRTGGLHSGVACRIEVIGSDLSNFLHFVAFAKQMRECLTCISSSQRQQVDAVSSNALFHKQLQDMLPGGWTSKWLVFQQEPGARHCFQDPDPNFNHLDQQPCVSFFVTCTSLANIVKEPVK